MPRILNCSNSNFTACNDSAGSAIYVNHDQSECTCR
jgi:hypothetical protein